MLDFDFMFVFVFVFDFDFVTKALECEHDETVVNRTQEASEGMIHTSIAVENEEVLLSLVLTLSLTSQPPLPKPNPNSP